VVVATISRTGSGSPVTEGGSASFTVSRVGDLSRPITVEYTVGGSAFPDDDYQLASRSVVIPAGESSATFSVQIIDDGVAEGTETAEIILASSPDIRYALHEDLNRTFATLDIQDHDPGVLVDQSGNSTDVIEGATAVPEVEGATSDTFTVVLNTQPSSNVTVQVLSDGQVVTSTAEYPYPSGTLTLTFTPSNWSTPQTVTVRGVSDQVAQGDHTSLIALHSNSNDLVYDDMTTSVLVKITEIAAFQQTVQTANFWKSLANKRIDVSQMLVSSNQEIAAMQTVIRRNARITAAYAEMFARGDNRNRFYWVGAAAYASKLVGLTMIPARADYSNYMSQVKENNLLDANKLLAEKSLLVVRTLILVYRPASS
jgi:hypothetical protein